MLLNLSNHPTSTWQPNQLALAQKQYGEVQDLPFPQINPEATPSELNHLAAQYLQKIVPLQQQQDTFAVHVMGELTFTFLMVKKLQELGIPCVASTTLRKTKQEGNRKISIFQFVQFRPYPSLQSSVKKKSPKKNKPSFFAKGIKVMAFGWNNFRPSILLTFVALTIVAGLIIYFQAGDGKLLLHKKNWWPGLVGWSEWLDPFIGVGVFLIAFNLWILNVYKQWKVNLEKRLTVSFIHDKNEVMRCEQAYLSSESDIRVWAQQIGRQMTGQNLDFEPFLKQTPPTVERDNNLNFFQHYRVTFFLTKRPTKVGLNEQKMKEYEFTTQIKQGEKTIWKRKS